MTENEHEEFEKRFMERKGGNLSMMMSGDTLYEPCLYEASRDFN